MATCTLVGLYPQAPDLPAPDPGASYAVYQVSGFSESGVQAFIRLVPALGLAMAQSNIPLDKIDGLSQLIASIANYIASGKIDDLQVLEFIEAIRQLI